MSKATQSLSGTAWVLAHCLHMVPGKEAQEMTPHGTGVCFILQATRPAKLCPSDTALNQRENGLVTPQRPGNSQSTIFFKVHILLIEYTLNISHGLQPSVYSIAWLQA